MGGHTKRGGGAKARKESGDEDGLKILGRGSCEAEEGEAEHGQPDGQPTPPELTERSPEERAGREAKNVQRDTEDANLGRDAVFGGNDACGGREDTGGEGGDHGGITQHSGSQDLLAQRPVLAVEGVIGALELDDVFFSVGKRWGEGLAGAEGR